MAVSELLAGRDEPLWASADGGRMATNTPHPVRSARRCISKFFMAAVAIGAFGALTAGPHLAQATVTQQHALSGEAFGYPIKPFDQEHPIRANLGDPRMQFAGPPTLDTLLHGSGKFLFHQGVDISAPNGTPVYPVVDGRVTVVDATREWVRVGSGGGREFEYWHIRTLVKVGQQVAARQTILGHITRPAGHVHLTEYENGRVVNPLVPGRLTPYHDSTRPTIRSITFRRTDTGPALLPTFLRGSVEIVADAEDVPTMPVPGQWHDLPTTPALITWKVTKLHGRTVVPEHTGVDFRTTVPSTSAFWRLYARGTYQNMCVFGAHYSYMQRGSYLFKLAPRFDTRSLHDGVYDLVVTATDIRGNSDSQALRFTVHNRGGWH
jgi:Peptidase family M23